MMSLNEAVFVITAARDGKRLQKKWLGDNYQWEDICPLQTPGEFDFCRAEYRVKPEKRHWVIRQEMVCRSDCGSQTSPAEIHQIKEGFNDIGYWTSRGFTHVVEV